MHDFGASMIFKCRTKTTGDTKAWPIYLIKYKFLKYHDLVVHLNTPKTSNMNGLTVIFPTRFNVTDFSNVYSSVFWLESYIHWMTNKIKEKTSKRSFWEKRF